MQTLELYYPLETADNLNYSICFNLEDGRPRTTVHNKPGWMLEPALGEETVPLAYLSRMRINLGNIPWWAFADFHREPRFGVWRTHFTADGTMIMVYGNAITAIFSFDESLDMNVFPPDDDAIQYVRHCLASTGHDNITTNYRGSEPELTMRLLWVEIPLQDIQEHLDVLGIKSVSEDEPLS